jgi:hypothetical protein
MVEIMHKFPKILHSLCLVVLCCLAACSLKERTDPLPPTFLEGAPLESTIPEIPFQHAWAASREAITPYDSVYIKPVRIDLLPADEWKRSRGFATLSQEDFEKDAALLARYFRIRLLGELNRVSAKRFAVVATPNEKTITVEIALTELVLSEPILRILAIAAPVPGVDLALSAFSDPHVAFAARFVAPDGSTLLGTVADRRFPPLRVIDLNKLRARSSAREIIAQWARELAESIQREELRTVKKSSWISLWIW